jgi:hypothetical protein
MAEHRLPIQLAVRSDTDTEGPHTTFPVGSTHPALDVQVLDASDAPLDLSAAVSATLTLSLSQDATPIVDAGMDFLDREAGTLGYRWRDSEVAEAGFLRGRITIRYRDGRTLLAPTREPLTVRLARLE